MYVTSMSIPLNFQSDDWNCQSLIDDIIEDYDNPARKFPVEGAFVMEWDFDDDDEAIELRDSLVEELRDVDEIELNNSRPNYSGIRIDVRSDDGMPVDLPVPEPIDVDEEEEEDDL